MTKNLTLFDIDAGQTEETLNLSFEAWLAHRQTSRSRAKSERALSDESINVYREMWHAFAKFCADRQLLLPDVTVSDLETFLAIRGTGPDPEQPRQTTRGGYLSARYANRYLMLIQRVSQYQARVDGVQVNHAAALLRERPEYKYAEAADKDPPPDYLDEMQARVLIAYLTRAPQPESKEKMT